MNEHLAFKMINLCVVKLSNSGALVYLTWACVPRLDLDHFESQSDSPRLNQRLGNFLFESLVPIFMKRLLIILLLSLAWPNTSHAINMPLTALDGSSHQLSEFEGKWVVVNYWATWCGPCIAEMPELQNFHDNNAGKAVVIGINFELASNHQLRKFLDDYSISYPIFSSDPAKQSELGWISGLPTTFLVSPQGKIEARQLGRVTRKMIEKYIQEWESQQTDIELVTAYQ